MGSTLEIGAVPMPGADPAHTGAHPGPGPSGAPQERWHFAAPGGTEGPIVADGLLYFGSFDPASETGNLYALDTAAGAQRWCTTTGWTVTAPSFADGTVFTEANTISGGHRQDFVVALAATTGEERWRFSIDSGQTGGVAGVAVADGTVYVGTGMGSLFALDESSGEARWLYEVDPDAESPEYQLGLPAIAADVVYVAGGNTLHALAAATGKELWRYLAEDDESLGTPTVSGGIVYVGGEHAVYAVDAKSGEEVWRFASESAGGNRLAVVDSVVYLGTGSETEATGVASLSAVDAESGHQLWRFDTEGYVSTPAVAGDTVYVGTGVQRSDGRQEGAVHALSAADGEELWNYPIDGIATTPIVAGGRVYVSAETARDGDEEQTLYAIGGTTATTDVARDPR